MSSSITAPPPPSRARCSSARALSRVSSYSAAGFESATMPAPAWTRAPAVADRDRADGDAEVQVAGEVDVADRAGVDVAPRRLELREDLHRADLRRARDRAGREARHQRVEVVAIVGELPVDRRDQVHDVRVALERHVLRHPHRAELADPAEVVAPEIDEHDVLGALLLVALQLLGRGAGLPPRCVPRGRVPAIGWVSTRRPSTRTSISGDDPTIDRPPIRMKYMYGDGLTWRSAR